MVLSTETCIEQPLPVCPRRAYHGIIPALDGAYQPAALNSKSVKFIATEIEKVAPESEGTMYEFIEESLHAAGDPVHYFELNFYLHNRLDNFYEKRPSEGFLLIGTNDAEKYLPEFEKEVSV